MIVHITTPDAWAAAVETGRYEPAGLATDGFIHLSAPAQVVVPANDRYSGRRDLVLLCVDETLLPEGGLRWEPAPDGSAFPHLYGPLPTATVTEVVPFPPDPDGTFRSVFVPMDAAEPPASDLIERMVAELVPLYGRIDGRDAPTATPADFRSPGGTFLVGWLGGQPVAGGGLKRLAPDVAEIKRMYVVPEARGRGLARRLLHALEDAARRRGYETVRLDTGPEQDRARALYDSAGYVEIADYNGNPHASYWAEKHLERPAAALPSPNVPSPNVPSPNEDSPNEDGDPA